MSNRNLSHSDIKSVSLCDIQGVLTLFARGLTGRELHLLPSTVTAPNSTSYPRPNDVGGNSINLPAEIDTFAFRNHNLGAYRIAVLREISHLESGRSTFDLNIAWVRMPPRSRFALHRAMLNRKAPLPQAITISDLELFFYSSGRPALLREVVFALEARRVDLAIRRSYPGVRLDLDRVQRYALSLRPPMHTLRPLAALIEGIVQFSLGAERAVLIDGLIQFSHGAADTVTDAQDELGLYTCLLGSIAAVQSERATIYDTAHAALDICAWIEKLVCLPNEGGNNTPVIDEFSKPDEGMLELASYVLEDDAVQVRSPAAPEDGDGFVISLCSVFMDDFGNLLRPIAHSTKVSEDIAESVHFSGSGEDETRGGNTAVDTDTRLFSYMEPHDDRNMYRGIYYDEWDYVNNAYLRNWCCVREQRLHGNDYDFIDEILIRYAPLARQIRQQFSFSKPQSRERMRRCSDGDELDVDGMIEMVIDRRTGDANDAYLYARRERRQRDVCTAFLVDMSGSTGFPMPDPTVSSVPMKLDTPEEQVYLYGGEEASLEKGEASPKRRVIDVAKEALALMYAALQTFDDKYAVYGFSGDGRDKVDFYIAKEFSDPPSARVGAALAAMEPSRSTRTGPAIRHAMAKLACQPERTKVLIVISDGYPEDTDYGPDPRDIHYGIQDTARALQEARRAGIATFCIAIDPAGHDYLRQMCVEKNYLVIEDVMDLPEQLSKIYRTLTMS